MLWDARSLVAVLIFLVSLAGLWAVADELKGDESPLFSAAVACLSVCSICLLFLGFMLCSC